ncbi:TetR/AcrR family transcriptional regulator [Traorella massiliensis]|uniref:TetR/AcrR family transcriptional regulator n=1 Tax=Traorella massiliensis TaxID=1903263 RepID=UPI0023556A7F|nr:TetR/AcrR family transcriptional regulator [Traorella massiliensis]
MIKTYAEKEITKGWIYDALISLINEMSYEKITITSICKKAGVPRSTFYRYYFDKDDVLKQHVQYFYEEMSYEMKQLNEVSIKKYIYYHLLFFKKNEKYFKSLSMIHKEHIFFDYISDKNLYFNFSDLEKDKVIFQAIALSSIIFNWVISKSKLNEKEMVNLIMLYISKDTLKMILPIFLNAHSKL